MQSPDMNPLGQLIVGMGTGTSRLTCQIDFNILKCDGIMVGTLQCAGLGWLGKLTVPHEGTCSVDLFEQTHLSGVQRCNNFNSRSRNSNSSATADKHILHFGLLRDKQKQYKKVH